MRGIYAVAICPHRRHDTAALRGNSCPARILQARPRPMFFQWPQYLWLMLFVPLLLAAYVWLLRRRGNVAVRFSSLGVVRAAAVGRNWRRHKET